MTLSDPALVIDAHTHIFPPFIRDSREAHRERDVWFAELYANPKALLVTAEDLVASMDRASITRSIACGFPWRDPGLCRTHNDYLAEAARAFPGRI
ncbi:MAG TPA: amidohydrolase, partial [Thermomicrobiaceae bacterium]|nr:amidohydrolase [Thermomicrobiaceae bacterium]